MIKLHPEILRKDGKEQFAVLPYEEFLAIQELLEDADDLRAMDQAKAEDHGEPGVPLEEVKRKLGIK